jgi:hypothetical protein
MKRRVVLTIWMLAIAAFGATVDGHVVNAFTGAGIAGITVSLIQQEHVAYNSTTDTQGRFRIDDVKDGAYTATYREPGGYPVPAEMIPGTSTFQVSGDGVIHLEAKLPPRGKLSGKVLDSAGIPVPGARLTLVWQRGGVRLEVQRVADAKGEYHLDDLPIPGTFSIAAAGPLSWKPPEPDGGQLLGWAQTFYPGVTDPQAAAKIVLPPGGELRDLDIKLATAPVHRMRVTVVDPRGLPAPGVSLQLNTALTFPRFETAKDDGTFEFPSATDGSWRISATLEREGVMLRASESVEINGHDVDVKLALVPPFSIQGKVVFEVPDGFPVPELPKITLGNQRGAPDRDGEFSIGNLYPGPFLILPDPPPASYYLDSIRLGSGSVPGPRAEILSGNLPLTLTYKHGGGTVRGTIESCGNGEVTLMPVEVALRHLTIMRNTRCDQGGKFEILAVRPGRYYAFALPFDDPFSPFEDPDTSIVQRSTVVTVVDSELVTPEIRLIKR